MKDITEIKKRLREIIDENPKVYDTFIKVYEHVGCSHHPQGAVVAMYDNEWNSEINPDFFEGDKKIHLLPKKIREKLSPQQRNAYEIFNASLLQGIGLGYQVGRWARDEIEGEMIELDLDELVDNNTSWWCGKLATEMTYRQLFPKSYAIDCIPILMIGLTLSPIAFMVGLAQREEDFSDQIYEK